MTEWKGAVMTDAAKTGHVSENDALRVLEALLFASPQPLGIKELALEFEEGVDVAQLIEQLQQIYQPRGVHLVETGGGFAFRTAVDLSPMLTKYKKVQKKLSKVALETLAIIAYHQPVTRAEIEDVRGVQISKGTLDVLLETGWVKMRGRRRAPGRPITYGTTELFLFQFGMARISDLPGLGELKGAGLLDGVLPPGFEVPVPSDDDALRADEEPLFSEEELAAEAELGSEEDPLRYKSDEDEI